ncbi:MAG: DUF1467 family protein [Nisaea sp.]|jgi:predicted secreted protein|uniref:DUF1467 family protein n=1 Tax=Nisaea sp. TaxID=2024842 RepID=UPI001B035D6C|nr:DUF1467 family protein [Nisaea sp.]MBO6559082.1 DUF1467 family protein [Nisaea sp.]
MQDPVSVVVVFLLLWWWFFLMALPIGVRVAETPEEGHAASAPRRPHLWKKAAGATVAAILGTFLVDYLIGADLFSFRDAIKNW